MTNISILAAFKNMWQHVLAEIHSKISALNTSITSTYETKTDASAKLTEAKSYTNDAVAEKADTVHIHAITEITNLQSTLDGKLSSSTKYAGSESVGGPATYAKQMSIPRIASNLMTSIAANLPVDTEAIYFGGSDAASLGCPTSYCIVNIKKGNNHRTILDCYNLTTGNHYINGNLDARVSTGWTGWKLQPNESHIHDSRYYTKDEIDGTVAVTSVNGATGAVTINEVPDCTTSDNGKILTVVNGMATWVAIPNAEEATF